MLPVAPPTHPSSALPIPDTPPFLLAGPSTLAGGGRGLFVKKPFEAGHVVMRIERPLVAIPDDKGLEKCCAWCMVYVGGEGPGETDGASGQSKDVEKEETKGKEKEKYPDPEDSEFPPEPEQKEVKLAACTGCRVVKYCSKDCQKLDWRHGPHKYECPIFASLRPRILPASVRCAVRVLLMKKHGLLEKKKWEVEIAGLEAHRWEFERDKEMGGMIKLMSLGVEKYSGTDVGLEGVVELYCKTLLNTFAIAAPTSANMSTSPSPSPSHLTSQAAIGNLFDPLASLINHSCEPNCVLEFDGRVVMVTALNRLRAGEEITVSYIGVRGEDRERRRKELQERWFFRCRCARCVREDKADEERLRTIRFGTEDLDNIVIGDRKIVEIS